MNDSTIKMNEDRIWDEDVSLQEQIKFLKTLKIKYLMYQKIDLPPGPYYHEVVHGYNAEGEYKLSIPYRIPKEDEKGYYYEIDYNWDTATHPFQSIVWKEYLPSTKTVMTFDPAKTEDYYLLAPAAGRG